LTTKWRQRTQSFAYFVVTSVAIHFLPMQKRSDHLAMQLNSPSAAITRPWSCFAGGKKRAWALAGAACGPVISTRVSNDTTAAKLARVEAILFLAREPLPSRKLAGLADLADGTEARSLVRELSRRMRRRGSAFQPVEVAHGVQLLTRPQLAPWLVRVYGPMAEIRLSPPALETLAVAAYRQPVTRADIEAIRGVQCGEILRVLMERDFLRIVGRSEELGRPFLYGTTRKFLQLFGLRRLEQLPLGDQIRNAAPRVAEALDQT
jgi:segregation and condensation protein B